MENRQSWTKVHHLIHEAIEEYLKYESKRVCGASLEATIYRRLDDAGVLESPAEIERKSFLDYD